MGKTRFSRACRILWVVARSWDRLAVGELGCRVCLLAVLLVGVLALVPAGASAEPLCTDTWTGASEGEWQIASNWSMSKVPSSTDVACIGAETTVKVTGGVNQTGVLLDKGTVAISAGSLELVSVLEASNASALTLSGGALMGGGTLDVTGALSWSGESTMSGSGSTVVESGASASIAIANGFHRGYLVARKLINEGTMTFSQGKVFASEGAKLENSGIFYGNNEVEVLFEPKTGGEPVVVNRGTFARTAGTGTLHIEVGFENTGTVEVQTGHLQLNGGGSDTGAWTVSPGALLAFDHGSVSLTGGSLAGPVEVGGASVTEEGVAASGAELTVSFGSLSIQKGTVAVEAFSLSGGTLTGAGTLEVTHSFSWVLGAESTMSGSGSTVVRSGGTGLISFIGVNDWAFLKARKLINEGTMTFSNGRLFMSEGAQLENSGVFYDNTEGDMPFEPGIGVEPSVVNRGTFARTAGTGRMIIYVIFANFGVLAIESGTIEFRHALFLEGSTQWGAENPSAANEEVAECGDGVGCATGNLSEAQADFTVGGRGVGLDLTRTYNSQAAAAGEHGPFGYGWSSSFSDHLVVNETSKITKLDQANGSTVSFAEGSGGSFTAPAWSQDKLSGTKESGYSLTLANQTVYKFAGASGRLESVTDRNGNATTLSYNEGGQLTTITDPASRTIVLKYNGEGLVESAEDPMKHVVKYTYEGGNLASVTQPGEAGLRWQFKYDGSHQLTELTDGRGSKSSNEYNGAHQVVSQTDRMKRVTSFEYNPFETRTTNHAAGSVTAEQFTSADRASSITRGFGTANATTETRTYDQAGDLLSVSDGNKHITSYEYDAASNKTKMLDANKNETKWTYDSTHDVETMTTPKGETTTYKRDSHGNPEVIERPAPAGKTQTTKYKYDAHGNVESMEDPLSRVWKYEYDAQGDRTAEIDPASDKRTWGYNEDSQETSMVNPRGHVKAGEEAKYTTKTERDAQGRPIKVTDPLGHETKYKYDGDGNVEVKTDPELHETAYTYDADNERTKVTEPNKTITETGYDGAGQVTSQTDGNKHETKYSRNILEQVTEITDPLGRKTTKEYDAAGNLKAMTDPAKRTTTFTYDAGNRLKEVSYSDGKTHAVKYEYDADGERKSMSDGTGETAYAYDQLDRLTETENGHKERVKYEYDLANQQTKITYPNTKAVTREYDKAGRLEKLTDWSSNITKFTYNADSLQATTVFPTTTKDEDKYAYNEADQMSEVKMTKGAETLASLAYTRNSDGQVKAITSKGLPGGEKPTYEYDTNSRLSKGAAIPYKYDAANNPTTIGSGTYKYDAASELETGPSLTYTYDELGERTKTKPTSGPATTYGYDQAGNLTSVERPKEGETAEIKDTYTYNGDKIRSSQTISGTTTYMAWEEGVSLPLLLSDGTNSYIYGPGGLPVEQISSGGTVTYLHHDQQGSTRLLTGSTGTVTGSTTFDAYGNNAGSTGTTTTPLGYDGQYTSTDTGLIYLRARSYDPATSQFLSGDPRVMETRELYSYAASDPTSQGDPSGLTPWSPKVKQAIAKCQSWKTGPAKNSKRNPFYRSKVFYRACEDLLHLPPEVFGTGHQAESHAALRVTAGVAGAASVAFGVGTFVACEGATDALGTAHCAMATLPSVQIGLVALTYAVFGE